MKPEHIRTQDDLMKTRNSYDVLQVVARVSGGLGFRAVANASSSSSMVSTSGFIPGSLAGSEGDPLGLGHIASLTEVTTGGATGAYTAMDGTNSATALYRLGKFTMPAQRQKVLSDPNFEELLAIAGTHVNLWTAQGLANVLEQMQLRRFVI